MFISQRTRSVSDLAKPIRIIVADDHEMVSECVIGYLRPRMKAILSSQTSFDAALKDALSEPCDLMLLDLVMPGMNGIASVSRMVKALPDTHVVIFSGATDQALLVNTIKAGASGFIPKDMALSALIPALNVVLSGQIFLPSGLFKAHLFGPPQQAGGAKDLTTTEIDLLRMVHRGDTNREIGDQIGLCENSVKMLMRKIFVKIGASNRTHAVNIAQSKGWI